MDEEKVYLSKEEFAVVKERVLGLAEMEEKQPGLVISRCNGQMDSTRRFLRKRLKDKESVNRCVKVLQNYGGFCNCEILFNVLPELDRMERDVVKDEISE